MEPPKAEADKELPDSLIRMQTERDVYKELYMNLLKESNDTWKAGEVMQQVIRYKCEYCQKLAVRPETIQRHEAVCLKKSRREELLYVRDGISG